MYIKIKHFNFVLMFLDKMVIFSGYLMYKLLF